MLYYLLILQRARHNFLDGCAKSFVLLACACQIVSPHADWLGENTDFGRMVNAYQFLTASQRVGQSYVGDARPPA